MIEKSGELTDTESTSVSVSIVVPMRNEEDAISGLIDDIVKAGRTFPSMEIIAVDDGSSDKTLQNLRAAQKRHSQLRVLHHPKSGGQSAAVHSGVSAARAPVCLTLDGDGQNPPAELTKLFDAIHANDKVGLVAGQRVNRKDTFSKRFASQFANGLRGWLLKDGTRDTGCGLKAFRRDAFLALPYFDHMHRYLPALFKAYGWPIAHVDVSHLPRTTGTSKYSNLQRGIAGLWDLMGVFWLIRRAKKVTPVEDKTNA